MHVSQITEKLIQKFSERRGFMYHILDSGGVGKLEYLTMEMLFEWVYGGQTRRVVLSVTVTRPGIVIGISVTDRDQPDFLQGEQDDDIYSGCSVGKAYTEVTEWLWRYSNVQEAIKQIKNDDEI